MTSFVQNGNSFKVIADGALDLKKQLPAGSYTVNQNPMTGEYTLVKVADMKISNKIYGDTQKRAKKILNTFDHRPATTGVLLVGRKGTGKTMLSKLVSQKAQEEYGYPTIVINEPHSGEGFNRFISDITQPCVILFDEFEKVYKKQQEELLTLFDGVYPTKKLFLVTSNSESGISEFMWNRPGRIFYRFNYDDIPDSEIFEYLKDNLQNTEEKHLHHVFNNVKLVDEISYDILRAITEDVNRYPDESIETIFDALNIDMSSEESRWEIVDIRSEARPGIEKLIGSWTGNSYYNIWEEQTCIPYIRPKETDSTNGPAVLTEITPTSLNSRVMDRFENIYFDPNKMLKSFENDRAVFYNPDADVLLSLRKEKRVVQKKFKFFHKGD